MSQQTKCSEHENETPDADDFTTNLISTFVLLGIELLGIFGNILVILVYSVKPKIKFSRNHQNAIKGGAEIVSSESNTLKSKRQKKFSNQRYLILTLAAIDLFTCIFILPWDLFIYFEILIRIDQTKSNYFELLNDLQNKVRTIAFALEGSVLAAIAIDRFLTVVFTTPSTASSRLTRLFFCHQKTTISSTSQCQNIKNKFLSFQNQIINNRTFIVWGSIGAPSICVAIIETGFFINERLSNNQLEKNEDLKKLEEKVYFGYFVAVILSSFVIFYLYLRVFFIVRRQDQKNMKLHSQFRQQPRVEILESNLEKTESNHLINNESNNNIQEINDSVDFVDKISSTTTSPKMNYLRRSLMKINRFSNKISKTNKGQRSRRTGLTLFISTVVFYATLLPVFLKHHYQVTCSFQLHQIYYINNAINVLIYSGLNPNFRSRLSNLRKRYFM